ncbi:MALT1 [Symbiodinium sp. CCMP2456]|nr:MALT1 [Symbiodinium sp. CCMP2456]
MHGRPLRSEPCTLLGRVGNKLLKDTYKEEADDEEAQVQAELCKQRHILCIGNDNYRTRTVLSSAASGAKNVHDLFNKLAFTCSLCQDTTTSTLRRKTRDFVDGLTDETKFAVLYFAGHGDEKDEEQRLLAIDAVDDARQAADGPSDMTVNEILKLFVESGAARNATFLLILDCCRDRPKLPEVSRRKGVKLLSKCVNAKRQLAVLFSCPSGGLVLDKMGSIKKSPMEFMLTKVLSSGLQPLSLQTLPSVIAELFDRIVERIPEVKFRLQPIAELWVQNTHADAEEEAELFMSPKGVMEWRRLRSAWREICIEEETYGSTTSTCKKLKTQKRADEIKSTAEQASHRRSIDTNRPSVAAIDEMLLSGRRDALLELLECRRCLLQEHEALKLKATQATAIRVVSEAVYLALDRLWERTRRQASEQREHLEQRRHVASLKDTLAKDVGKWDEMSEWLLGMALHVLNHPSDSESHEHDRRHDRRQLAESIRNFLATVNEAVRNSCTGQEATQAITVREDLPPLAAAAVAFLLAPFLIVGALAAGAAGAFTGTVLERRGRPDDDP